MDKIDELLRYIHRTNPEMTREKLINELSRSDYAARAVSTNILYIHGFHLHKLQINQYR